MADQTRMQDYLAENPKMAGVLFTICLLLTQMSGIVAAGGGTNSGP